MITLRPGDLKELEAELAGGAEGFRRNGSRNLPPGEEGCASASLGSEGSIAESMSMSSYHSSMSNAEKPNDRACFCCSATRLRRLESIVTSTRFNMSMGTLIVINMVIMSIELDMHPMARESEVMLTFFDYPDIPQTFFDTFEAIFFFIFGFELVARCVASRGAAFRDLSTYIDGVALMPIVLTLLFDLQQGKHLMLLRVVRLMKLFRLLRLIRLFKELQFLAKSFVSALRTLVWIGLLLLMTVYCVAIVCTMLVGQNENFKATDSKIRLYEAHYGVTVDIARHWGSIMRSVLTLFQIFTLDNWSELVRPIIETHAPWMFFFFAAFIFTTSFGLLNLLMGAIVDHTMSVAREAEMERERVVKEEYKQVMLAAGRLFAYIDQDHDGMLSANELMDFLSENNLKEVLQQDMASLHLKIDYEELNEICHNIAEEWLDSGDINSENDGISMEEFVGAAMRLQGPARSQDLLATLIAAKSALSHVQVVDQSIRELQERLEMQNEDMVERFTQLTLLLRGRSASNNSDPISWHEGDDDAGEDAKLSASQGTSVSTSASAPGGQVSTVTTPSMGPPSASGSPVMASSGTPPAAWPPWGKESAEDKGGKDKDKDKDTDIEPAGSPRASPLPSVEHHATSSSAADEQRSRKAASARRASVCSVAEFMDDDDPTRADSMSKRCAQKMKARMNERRNSLQSMPDCDGAEAVSTPSTANALSLKTERGALGKHASRRMTAILTELAKDDTYSNAKITNILRSSMKPGNRSPSEGSEEDKDGNHLAETVQKRSAVERAADAFRLRRTAKSKTVAPAEASAAGKRGATPAESSGNRESDTGLGSVSVGDSRRSNNKCHTYSAPSSQASPQGDSVGQTKTIR